MIPEHGNTCATLLPRVILLPRRAKPFYSRHPWVYAGAIASIQGNPGDGDEVELFAHTENFIARGFFNSLSKIRVRLYSWAVEEPLDEGFFRRRIEQALHLRATMGLMEPGHACRLVFSEADGLSGLVVDRYDRWLIVQFTALALAKRREQIIRVLQELLAPEGIYLRTERGIGKLEGLDAKDGLLSGSVPTEPITITEEGLQFRFNITEGQKTGFYLDQRENRSAVARWCKGRRVLDAFCYVGGFGLHAARAGASQVVGIDASEPALKLAAENAALNGLDQTSFVQADVFDYLQTLAASGEKFDLVVLDPPKFARTRNAVEDALQGYRRLQTLALRLLAAEGILVTCCCSGLIAMPMLEELLAQLAVEENRTIQVLERRGQSADHPVATSCPESNYLKCLICRVL
jgi:23S rRNA (cytosine1962-C5)-methyltransferase